LFPFSGRGLEQPVFHVGDLVNGFAISFHDAIRYRHLEPAEDEAGDLNFIRHPLDKWRDHATQLDFADAERPPTAGLPQPAQEETRHLPQRIEPEAARHDRIALEVAAKEPEVGLDVEFSYDLAKPGSPTILGDFGDPIEHQHGWQRQLGIPRTEKLSTAAGQKILIAVT